MKLLNKLYYVGQTNSMNPETEKQAAIARILVVDDEPFMQMQIRLYLQREGHQVYLANNGEEALKVYQSCQPDLVLLDALMPVMDGFQCCRFLTQGLEKFTLPVLMITGLEDETSVDLAFDAGATDYITKPIHWPVLRQRVKRLLYQTRLQKQLEVANQQLQKLALLDGLTQINNRRAFDLYLEQEWLRCLREEQPLALILADVDFFKCYNDFYGHPTGDSCLQKVAQLLCNSVTRATDIVARYGGEEFAIILPNTSQEGAIVIAKRILANIRSLAIPQINLETDLNSQNNIEVSDACRAIAVDYVTLSLGLAVEIPQPYSSLEQLIEKADQCLFKAKRQGRDRLVFQSEGTTTSALSPGSAIMVKG